MSEPTFSAVDPSTWPVLLTTAEVAAIYRRKVGGLRKAVWQRTFHPAPMLNDKGDLAHPFRWRRADVLRHVEGARGANSRLRAVGR